MSSEDRMPAGASGLAHFVVSRPVAVTMLVAAVCVFGFVSLSKLPVTLLPELSYPTLTVRTTLAGAAPSEIEELVTKPLEENLAVVGDLNGYRSISRAGGSDIVLEFAWNTPMTFAVQDVREKVDQLLPRLPRGVERPLILRYDPTLDPVLRIGFYGEADLFRLREFSDLELKRRLESIPGVAAVKVKGGFEREIRVSLKEARLRQYKIAPELVNQRLQAENVNVPGGILRDGDVEYLVRTLNEFKTPEEIGELVVTRLGDRPVRLRDVADVAVVHKERDVITRIEGAESVEIEIYKEADANLVQVAHAVKSRLFGKDWRKDLSDGDYVGKPAVERPAEGFGPAQRETTPLAATLPPGMKLKVLSDQSVFIESALDEVRDNALTGSWLAIVVLYAFLRRFKPTFIIAISIPISIVATFAPLYLMGVTLNIMSLGGLALGVGMLVDNSIVVLEAVTRRRELGEGVFSAAVNGAREMGLSVFASTLTTVVVFLPIVFVEGSAGQIFRDQALAVVFSLLASLVAAVVLVPMLASLNAEVGSAAGGFARRRAVVRVRRHLLPRRWPSVRMLSGRRYFLLPLVLVGFALDLTLRLVFLAWFLPCAVAVGLLFAVGKVVALVGVPFLRVFDRAFTVFQTSLGAFLRASLRARAVVLLLTCVAAYLAYAEFPSLKQDLIPAVRQGIFYAEVQLDVGTPIERTDERAKELESRARADLAAAGIPLAGVSSSVGVPRDAIAKPGDGPHTARLYFQLRTAGSDLTKLEDRARDVVRRTFSAVTGVGVPLIDAPQLFQSTRPLEIEVTGEEPAKLREASTLIERGVAAIPGVTGTRSTVRRGRPEIVIVPDRDALARYDLKLGEVAELIRAKVEGRVATYFSERDRKIEVRTRLPDDELRSAAAIAGLQVNPGRLPAIPLSAVARVEVSDGPAEVRHVGGRRAEIVSADLAGLDLRGAGRRLTAMLETTRTAYPDLFRAVSARLGGQNEESAKSNESLMFALYLAIFLVYLVMAAQFESLVHPLVIMFTIPLALIGVVFALSWTSTPISVIVFIGVILLAGIVVNNAIILIDTVNRLRRDGVRRDAALLEAARIRLRPIAMTTGTTVLGLLPLAVGLGEGAEIRKPMAIVVIAGLVSSTLLTLIVIPVVYSLLSRPGPLPPPPTAEIRS